MISSFLLVFFRYDNDFIDIFITFDALIFFLLQENQETFAVFLQYTHN